MSSRAPRRATSSSTSTRSRSSANRASISARSRSVGDTRRDTGVGPPSSACEASKGTYVRRHLHRYWDTTLLTALHVGMSFALGRWAAPMLPVGEDSAGKVVWEDWHPGHCDPARRTSPGWWHEQQHTSLTDFLGRVITAFADPDRLPALR